MSQRRRMARALRPVARTGDTADVYVEGEIGDRSGTTAASFREQLTQARGAKTLRVHFNSPGGVVTEGMAIYNALRAHSAKKIGIVEGLAASIASVILMGCDEIKIAKGAFIMIHNPHVVLQGGADDLRKGAEDLDKMRGEILDAYEARTGIERGKLEKLVDEETYFTAEEAVKEGIADSIENFEAKIALKAVARLDPKKVPAGLRAAAVEKNMKSKAEKKKALEEKAAALAAEMAALEKEPEDSEEEEETDEEEETKDDDEEEASAEEEKEESKALVQAVKDLTGSKSAAIALGKLTALISKGTAAAGTARADLVAAAIKAGKLPPSMKATMLKASEKTFAAYLRGMGGAASILGRKHKQPNEEKGPKGEASDDEPTAEELKSAKLMGLTDNAKATVKQQILAARKQTMIYGGSK